MRNEMSELEELGYLEQPHTSAGRVPTALGYKTYVNSLMERYRLSLEELSLLNELTAFKVDELGKIMEQASHVISEMTNYPAFAVIRPSEADVSRYETVLIDEHGFLLIMICADGSVRSRNVKLKSSIDKDASDAICKALNSVIAGAEINCISLPVVLKFEEALGQYAYLSTPVLRVIYEMSTAGDTERVHVEGVTKLFSYPEFNSVTKAGSAGAAGREREIRRHAVRRQPRQSQRLYRRRLVGRAAARFQLCGKTGDRGRKNGGRHRRYRTEADGLQKGNGESGIFCKRAVGGAWKRTAAGNDRRQRRQRYRIAE